MKRRKSLFVLRFQSAPKIAFLIGPVGLLWWGWKDGLEVVMYRTWWHAV